MAKPKVTVNPVANQYTEDNERIIEFSDRQLDGAGGLISFRRTPRGRLTVSVYRCDERVDVFVGRPDRDSDSWDARLAALALAGEGLRRVTSFLEEDSEEYVEIATAVGAIAALTQRTCLWGQSNGGVDCGYGPDDRVVRGGFFCEVHAEGVEDDEGIDVSLMR